MTKPDVTVIVPVHDAREYLREAVQSVLDEALPALEVIVVDDGSTDGSTETLAGLPVRIERFPSCRGAAAARNQGLRLATGEVVVFLDADDRLAPGGLRWRLDYLRDHPDAAAVAGLPAAIIDEAGTVLPTLRHLHTPGYVCPDSVDLAYFQSGRLFPVLLWLYAFRRATLERIGFFDETLRFADDCEYVLRILESLTIPVLKRPTIERRWHARNLSLMARDRLDRELNPATKAEVTEIGRRYGIEFGSTFHLWEHGFQPMPKT